jgi:hypothetical protein
MGQACRLVLIALIFATRLGAIDNKGRLPENGVIPDERTAIAVAEAVFRPVYGKDYVDKFRPYHAVLEDNAWTVYGTLRPAGAHGGTPQLRINKADGRVLEIWHSM